MDKPISIILDDAKQSLINTINSLQLHPSLLELIIKELYSQVKFQAEKQLELDKIEYKKEKESAEQ